MTRRAARMSGVLAAALLAAAGPPVAAQAVDQSRGHPGFCADGAGSTVVIDFQQLGGTTIVRCDPQSGRGTGLDALKGAGFQIAGVQRWGEAFICRIENRPSAVEEIPVKGDEHYRESCVDTPPAAGYWSYWHAGNNCAWQYSQWGVKNRDFTPGGFEGWSFSLNATADANPVPRIAPVRPGTAGQSCATAAEPAPNSDDPRERQAPRGSGNQPAAPEGHGTAPPSPEVPAPGQAGAGGRALPPPKPRPEGGAQGAPDPRADVAFTGGEQAPDVDQAIKAQTGASDYAPWAAGAAVLLLAAAAGFTARRRRRARNQ
ncbi:ABC transporter substrate-binding protein [Amycolatopsis sp. PS_44_ISF1]|uniref:ABC transporter substrate-binding protein n=1 Tax=Amycolatopsis sp. PS_44_ISF1 TaxID=2974917 RepID=UPI0028DE1C8F|nr:ABC transporter substrate-binding protein [Amycolatopsis sp. PS_44_ISF1]MDT8913242.1 ABC transporter substrate-binding protein [Amycolatopsis sp. PS_44_ISF1]